MIFEESQNNKSPDLLDSEKFLDTTNIICKMAFSDMMQAAIESNYMQDFYDTSQYQKLENA